MRLVRQCSNLGFAIGALLVLCPAIARAQAATPQQLSGSGRRVDLSAGVGWYCARVDDAVYERWYNDAASYDVQVGYYVTENVKIELGAAAAGEGRSWSADTRIDARGRVEHLNREHFFHVGTVSGALVYQFRRNAWIHPFLGAGVDVDRERERVITRVYPIASSVYPGPYDETDTTKTEIVGGMFAVAGLKTYFNERTFFRADLKVGGLTDADKVVARMGFGVDF